MSNAAELSEVERQLLMAAAVHGLVPTKTLHYANTYRVVNQVLRWRGLSREEVEAGWQCGEECQPGHAAVYATLVRMTHQRHREGPGRAPERPGPALFEGRGNWGVPGDHPPCWPQYNACRLTAEGERVARDLLEQQREQMRADTIGPWG